MDEPRARYVEGTTLAHAAAPARPGASYSRLLQGPAWLPVLRQDLAEAKPGRAERRRPMAAFVQVTDVHVTDVESPARVEFLHPLVHPMFRPQEALGLVSTVALIERVNALTHAPFTGRPLDFAISTGDNTDNHEHLELDWLMCLFNGGRIDPRSGDRARYEGVQASGEPLYWHPGDRLKGDRYAEAGFPYLPGLLDHAVTREFASPGLRLPWYSAFGNHDDSVLGGIIAGGDSMADWYTGTRKAVARDERGTRRVLRAIASGAGVPMEEIFGPDATLAEVTADERRSPFTPAEYVQAHLDPANTGPGPVGHGFTEANADGRDAYYTFRVAPGVLGVSLDTTCTGGFGHGSIGQRQLTWLEDVLTRHSSASYGTDGRRRTHPGDDELVIVFSHHSSETMSNTLPDLRRPDDPRLLGDALVALLHRFPNVLAWVNGHTHYNRVTPHPGPTPAQGFWEVNTASHVDFPQHARVVEVADNADGTVSLFTTLVEADSPYAAEHDDWTPRGLAALYRELAYNDIHADRAWPGEPGDRNTELVLPHPFA
ncbi:TIGR03767 family metallophosphoesterase [Yinghuangia seranimata]|uniref:TIGR03767 family metallophosphoesterase n=1 Tax=Yinghuangia seranimata TaxID=408067 RepID=UPI00248CD063|nr:TIGR03767 family metallophosphoesterase [Yinghuangia seranimata]MDI2125677.1 TIGR03767 family metallophosphoesterase [Yinghuangia seranimata]